MLQQLLFIGVGLALLGAGGELLVRGASRLAALSRVPPLVIGLTVVAFGTSAPELAVTVQGVEAGAGELALGNVLGSNVMNVLVILGLSALLAPLTVTRRVIWVQVPVVIAVTLLAFALAADQRIDTVEGMLLLVVIVAYVAWLLRTVRSSAPAPDTRSAPLPGWRWRTALLSTLAGLGLLFAGGQQLVEGATTLALALGVSEAVVGLTVVAFGTSVPEVAAAVVAALRGHSAIAVGNVLGSNVFNLTLILGTASVWGGGMDVPPGLLTFDFVVVAAVTFACLPIFYTGHRMARTEGALLLGYYVVYVVFLVLEAGGHPSLGRMRDAVLFFALPITVVTLALFVLKERGAKLARRGRRP